MTNQEILKKAIKKAENNGYSCDATVYYALFHCTHFCHTNDSFYTNEQNFLDVNNRHEYIRKWHSIYNIIFSHAFAEAFWGEEIVHTAMKYKEHPTKFIRGIYEDQRLYTLEGINENKDLKAWQYYLQQMVILTDDEKFKYLEKFLDKENKYV